MACKNLVGGIKEVVIIYSTDDFLFLARKGTMGENVIFTGQLSQIEYGDSSSKGFAGSSSTENVMRSGGCSGSTHCVKAACVSMSF